MRAQAHLSVHTTLLKSFMSFMVLYVHRIDFFLIREREREKEREREMGEERG